MKWLRNLSIITFLLLAITLLAPSQTYATHTKSNVSPVSGSTINDATPNISFDTSISATCRISRNDESYDNMSDDIACSDLGNFAGYWKMDESSWNGTSGEVVDSSSNGNNGTSGGGVTTVAGKYNNAGNFDGSNDYVDLGNPNALKITGNQTISMWLNPTTFNARRNPFAKAYGGEGTITQETNGTLSYYWGTAGANAEPYQGFNTSTPIPLNQWSFVTLVRNLDTMNLYWYINGALVSQTTAAYSAAVSSTNTAYIGKGYVSNYAGKIDDLRIYNRALSAQGIEYLYTNQSTSTICAPSDLGYNGAKSLYVACFDSNNDKDSSSNNLDLSYTLTDNTPPVISSVSPASGAITDSTPTITFFTNENATCRLSTTDESYEDMINNVICSGAGTTSHSCQSTDLQQYGPSSTLYVACTDSRNNKHTISSNTHISYDLFSVTSTTISSSYGTGIGMEIGQDGFQRISFIANSLYHVRCTNTSCSSPVTTQVVADADGTEEPGSYLLTLGSDGFARMLYNPSDLTLGYVRCLNADCTSKNTQIIDTSGNNGPGQYGMTIVMGDDDLPRIAYSDYGDDYDTHFVRCTNANCSSVVDTNLTTQSGVAVEGSAYSEVSMAIGTDHFARIIYMDGNDSDLKMVRCTNADCTSPVVSTIDSGSYSPGGYGTVIRMGWDGYPRIASIDYSRGSWYIVCSNADCSSPTLTQLPITDGRTHNGPGMDLNSSDLASIAYSDVFGYVKILQCTNTTCSTYHDIYVETATRNGMHGGGSLVVGSDNTPYLAYSDTATGIYYAYLSRYAAAASTPTPTAIPSSNSESPGPQISAQKIKESGGTFTPSGDSSDEKQDVAVQIEAQTFDFDAFVSAKTTDLDDLPKPSLLNRLTNNTGTVTAGDFLGLKTKSGIAWQVGQIQEIWYKAYAPGYKVDGSAKIIPELQEKVSNLSISFADKDLVPPGQPNKKFNAKQLKIAQSIDGVHWTILKGSVVDPVNHTVAVLTKIGGYYMIVADSGKTPSTIKGVSTQKTNTQKTVKGKISKKDKRQNPRKAP